MGQLLDQDGLGGRQRELLAVIASPEALETYLLRAQSQADTKRRAQRAIEAVQQASNLAHALQAGTPAGR